MTDEVLGLKVKIVAIRNLCPEGELLHNEFDAVIPKNRQSNEPVDFLRRNKIYAAMRSYFEHRKSCKRCKVSFIFLKPVGI